MLSARPAHVNCTLIEPRLGVVQISTDPRFERLSEGERRSAFRRHLASLSTEEDVVERPQPAAPAKGASTVYKKQMTLVPY